MKQLIKISSEFELLSENSDGFLVSGFSTALTSKDMMHGGSTDLNISKCGETNNCNGGNCVSGCSS